MSVNWLEALRGANYAGVPFHVERDEIKVGRALIVHQFPNRDRPFIEDVGEEAITYSVTGYVASDSVIAEKNALLQACRRRGAYTLTLPTEGPNRVRCKSARRTHEKDKMGFIAFTMEFVEAGQGIGFGAVFGVIERLVGRAAGDAVPLIVGDFLNSYDTLGDTVDWVIASAEDTAYGFLDLLDGVVRATALTDDVLSTIRSDLEGIARDVPRLVRDGPGTIDPLTTYAVRATPAGLGGEIGNRIYAVMNDIRTGAQRERDAYDVMLQMAYVGRPGNNDYALGDIRRSIFAAPLSQPSVQEPGALGISAAQETRNREAFLSMVRRFALIEMATVAAEADWDDRNTAVGVRANVAQAFEPELERADGRTFAGLQAVRGKASEAISGKLADLNPVVLVEAQASLPSIVWAQRLYGDATRAGELIKRNRIVHPSFMPEAFEAEAPLGDQVLEQLRRQV